MSLELQLVLALILDALFGDPHWFPHPVRLIGRLAYATESLSRRMFPSEKVAGMFSVLVVLAVSGGAGWGLIMLAGAVHPVAGDIVSVLMLYFCFAARDLVKHSKKVADALHESDLEKAREKVGMIVGRDTATLDKEGVIKACVESVAENTVDGITAPLFWAAIGGPVGALLYKAVNTMDSVFGYKNEQYLHFGWAAAKLDDLVNWLPARLTGLIMVLASLLLGLRTADSWKILLRDRLHHSSPNSGHAEAAVAGALGIRLGGPSMYFGKQVDKPFIGDNCFSLDTVHITKTNQLMITTVVVMTSLLIGLRIFLLVIWSG